MEERLSVVTADKYFKVLFQSCKLTTTDRDGSAFPSVASWDEVNMTTCCYAHLSVGVPLGVKWLTQVQ